LYSSQIAGVINFCQKCNKKVTAASCIVCSTYNLWIWCPICNNKFFNDHIKLNHIFLSTVYMIEATRGKKENIFTLINRYAKKINCNSDWLYTQCFSPNNEDIIPVNLPSGRKSVILNIAQITNNINNLQNTTLESIVENQKKKQEENNIIINQLEKDLMLTNSLIFSLNNEIIRNGEEYSKLQEDLKAINDEIEQLNSSIKNEKLVLQFNSVNIERKEHYCKEKVFILDKQRKELENRSNSLQKQNDDIINKKSLLIVKQQNIQDKSESIYKIEKSANTKIKECSEIFAKVEELEVKFRNGIKCSFCEKDIANLYKNFSQLECGHVAHSVCLQKIVAANTKKKCPVCMWKTPICKINKK